MSGTHVNNPLRLSAAESCEGLGDGVDCRVGEVERELRGQAGTNFAGRILPQHNIIAINLSRKADGKVANDDS